MDLPLHNLPVTHIAADAPKVARCQSEPTEMSTNSGYFALAPPQSRTSQVTSQVTSQEFKLRRSPKVSIKQFKPASLQLMDGIRQPKNITIDGINVQKAHLKMNSAAKKKTSPRNQKKEKSLEMEEICPINFTSDEIQLSNFCLQGFKKAVLSIDVFRELVLNQINTVTVIKDIHAQSHAPNSGDDVPMVRKSRSKQGWVVNDQFQKRILKQANTSCMFAVQQAYQDQQRINCRRKRMGETQQQYAERCLAKEQRQELLEKKRNMTMQEKEIHNQQINQGISQNAVKKTKYLEKQRERRRRAKLAHTRMEEDIMFAQEFDQRQFTITRALSKNDMQQLEEKATLRKKTSVKELKEILQANREKIRNFNAQKIVIQQAKSIEQNMKIRESISQIAVQKLHETQMRVSQQKTVKKQNGPYKLPRISVNKLNKGKSEGIEQWQEMMKIEERII